MRGTRSTRKNRLFSFLSFSFFLSLSFLSTPPPAHKKNSPNVRVDPRPHGPVARRGGLVAPRLQRRELPEQLRVRLSKGVAAAFAVAGAAAAAVGGVDVFFVPAIEREVGTQGSGKRKREKQRRAVSGREEGKKKKVDRRGRLFPFPPPSSSLCPLFSLFVDDIDAVEDLVYAHLVERERGRESLWSPEMPSSTRAREREREREKGEKPK